MPLPFFLGFLAAAAVMAALQPQKLLVTAQDCPLDLSWPNFTLAASTCSSQNGRTKCCRYMNALVAVSVARYAKTTGSLGVPAVLTNICHNYVSETLHSYGIPPNATAFCGLGTKILFSYQCQGRTTILEMLQSPNFHSVTRNCKMPLSSESSCRRCLNSDIIYLHHLIGVQDNITLSTCRDAAFVALANQGESISAIDFASCFFGIQELIIHPGQLIVFRRFSYREIKKATNNFSNTIGRGGFATVYRAQFDDSSTAAVKRMKRFLEHGEREFYQEMELIGRLHHRHLVALRGFCIERHERFLVYEYMEKGSLKDHLHSPERAPLGWHTRIQIAIDVANALEYLHFYCDPPLCHSDIKASNILLDGDFRAKVADFGLAHASSRGAEISFEPANRVIQVTPGYVDPEFVVTRELTEKSDVYSYGVLLLELVTGRRTIHDSVNLVEWSQEFMESDSKLPELVDPRIAESFDLEQLEVLVRIIQWCTEREGTERPSIKQVLRLLYERLDPLHSELLQAIEDEEGGYGLGSTSKQKPNRDEMTIPFSGDARCLQSSSSTSRSCCSRSVVLETSPPQSPAGNLSV